MSFQKAVKATPAIAHHYKRGLQALPREHRSSVRTSDPRRLDGSVDLDEALRAAKPNDPRWDYGVGLKARGRSAQAFWIEPHPASSLHVNPVLGKLRWLREWLKHDAPALYQLKARYIWLATGRVALPTNSPQRRAIAAEGLELHAQLLNLDQFRN
jgi:hypothetical protein